MIHRLGLPLFAFSPFLKALDINSLLINQFGIFWLITDFGLFSVIINSWLLALTTRPAKRANAATYLAMVIIAPHSANLAILETGH